MKKKWRKIRADKFQRRANGGPNVMLSDNIVSVIRSLFHKDQLAIKDIARRLSISRNTVRKFLESNRDAVKAEFYNCELRCLPLQRTLLEKYQSVFQGCHQNDLTFYDSLFCC